MLRTTKTLQPFIRSRLSVAQRGFHVSRPVQQGSAGGTPNPETQRNNRYMMYGGGALGAGLIFYYLTAKPEQAKTAPK